MGDVATAQAGYARRMEEQPASVLRVVLADDHELVRSGFRALLAYFEGVAVVGEARDGQQLLELLRTTPADLVLCDLAMPRMDGLQAIAHLRSEHPRVRTIVVSMETAPAAVHRALANGACGYVAKQAACSDLEEAIRIVAAGGRYVSPSIEQALQDSAGDAPERQLTQRQIQILRLIAQGRSARDIAGALGLSPNTVDVHRSRIMERLGIHDIAGLTRYAMRHRLVD